MKTIFELKNTPSTSFLPKLEVPKAEFPKELLRTQLNLPELNEIDVIRHYTRLSKRNFGVDNGFYPLGSCTMKYNPKINEDMARLPKFAFSHPFTKDEQVQGNLELMYTLQKHLLAITGMDALTLQPASGAHGELTGLMIIKAFFEEKGEKRTKVITPDSSHGTNPATANMCSYETITIKSDKRGQVDIKNLKKSLSKDVAAIMLTVPNTLGIFEENILEITKLCHDNGTKVYMDGANMNALSGQVLPKDMGIDVLHLNLHKTFSTPHGGGGPGAGPVGVTEELAPYLPVPLIAKKNNMFYLDYDRPKTIGRVKAFHGNFGILVRAYTYISSLGGEGVKRISDHAVLNANYLQEKLKKHFHLPFDQICKHEFVLDDSQLANDVHTTDLAKRLIDYGYHPPTIHFPLIVHGAIMIEPTETENKETLDGFADVMIAIKEESASNPNIVKKAPHSTPVGRLDDVQAARNPILRFNPNTLK